MFSGRGDSIFQGSEAQRRQSFPSHIMETNARPVSLTILPLGPRWEILQETEVMVKPSPDSGLPFLFVG